MKILSITAQKPSSTGSGVYLTELVKSWHQMGHRQAVAAGICREDQVILPEGVDFYPVFYESEQIPYPTLGMSDTMPYRSTRYRDLTEEQADQFRKGFHKVIKGAVEELDPDVIICHHLYFLTALVRSWFPERRVFGICHGTCLRQLSQIPFQGTFIREQIRKLDGILALHQAQKEDILRIFSCEENRVSIIGAGYNHEIFYPEAAERAGQESDPETVERAGQAADSAEARASVRRDRQIVFAGKVCEKKGVFSLIRALDLLSYPADRLQVKIAGGYKEKEEYEKIEAAAAGARVPITFLGPVPQQRLAQVFRESDVFVLPSFFEGLALVTLEAMACGCQVVCSDIPGMAAWFAENIPGHEAEFVPMPEIRNVDEPVEEELPAFEARLAAAIDRQLAKELPAGVDMSRATWVGIGEKVLEIAEAIRVS